MAAANRMCRLVMIAQPMFSIVEPIVMTQPRSIICSNLPRLSIMPAAGITAITVIKTFPSFCSRSKFTFSFFFALGTSTGSFSAGASTASSASRITASPCFTLPATGVITLSSAPSQTRTGVIVLIPLLFSRSRSTSATRSPTRTLSPTFTWDLKPSPFRATVSRPTWTRTSRPSSELKPYACNVSATDATSPSTGL